MHHDSRSITFTLLIASTILIAAPAVGAETTPTRSRARVAARGPAPPRATSRPPARPRSRPATDELPEALRDPRLQAFVGTYRLAGDREDGAREIHRAYLEAMEQIPNFLRPTLRRQMERHDYLVESITIGFHRDRISTRARAYRNFTLNSVPGEVRTYTSKNGNETHLLQRLVGDQLEVTLETRRGRMHNVLTLGQGGRRLHVAATFSSPLLDRPIRIGLSYDRVVPPRRQPARAQRRRGAIRRRRARPPRARPRARRIVPGARAVERSSPRPAAPTATTTAPVPAYHPAEADE